MGHWGAELDDSGGTAPLINTEDKYLGCVARKCYLIAHYFSFL